MEYRKAFVLGGSSGLGLEIVNACLASGVQEVVSVSASVPSRQNGQLRTIRCDLVNTEDVFELLQLVRDNPTLKGIDLFFWNAGLLRQGEFADLTSFEIHEMIQANLAGPLPIIHAIWQQMQLRNRAAHFVVVASTSGRVARANETVYVAAKHAQVGFAHSLALENKDPCLKILLVMPGGMKTPFWDGARPANYDSFLDPAKVAKRIMDKIEDQLHPFEELEIPRGSL